MITCIAKYGQLNVFLFIREKRNNDKKARSYAFCVCDCGNFRLIRKELLKKTKVPSCGCLIKEDCRKRNTIHGIAQTRIYKCWCSMRRRCENENDPRYNTYGLRGITVCSEWQDCTKFYDWAINNGYKEDLTIERIDINKGYCPENCTWITRSQQSLNTTKSFKITIFKETKISSEWAKDDRCNVSRRCFERRIRNGWNPEQAITEPSQRIK